MPTRRASPPPNAIPSTDPPAVPGEVADRLHSAAIHLLRRVRREDEKSGVTAPRLSALSVLVFGGPRTLGELAQAEHVRPPTMSRVVDALEQQKLVVRESVPGDARRTMLRATPRAEAILREGRARRVEMLAEAVAALPERERLALGRAVATIEKVIARL